MKVIGLAGRAGSGKSTTAGLIRQLTGFYEIGFADPLRRIASELFGVDPNCFVDRDEKERDLAGWGLSPRQILQRLGTEVGRQIHPDVWVRYAQRRIEHGSGRGWVISDCRFQNEIDMIHRLGGGVWWIERESAPVANHASENSIGPDDCDWVIDNTGTIQNLQENVVPAIRSMFPDRVA